MPLIRGDVVGYDFEKMTFRFTMLTPEAKTIDCEISSTAMDFLARSRGTPPSGRELQFLSLRDQIELLASAIFDKERLLPIRVFTKHLGNTKKGNRLW
jgi:hypothetical protein